MDRATFETTYIGTGSTFEDNSTRNIGAPEIQQFAQDISDTFLTSADTILGTYTITELTTTWNMDTTSSISVLNTIDPTKIKSYKVTIKGNTTDSSYPLELGYTGTLALQGAYYYNSLIDYFILERKTGGDFDAAGFNAASVSILVTHLV